MKPLEPLQPLGGSAPPPPPPELSLATVIANTIGVTPAWADVALGCWLFLLLQTIGLSFASAAGASSGEAAAAVRVLATGLFIGVQQAGGVPFASWLTAAPALALAREGEAADGKWWLAEKRPPPLPFLSSPFAAPAAAVVFALAIAALGTGLGAEWLPPPRPLPGPLRAVDILAAAPLTEEIFFRAWLLVAMQRAGASELAALGASSVLFACWHAPLVAALGDPSELFFFGALGAWLTLLYQKSDGSLPLAVGTHATFNLIVTLLRARPV